MSKASRRRQRRHNTAAVRASRTAAVEAAQTVASVALLMPEPRNLFPSAWDRVDAATCIDRRDDAEDLLTTFAGFGRIRGISVKTPAMRSRTTLRAHKDPDGRWNAFNRGRRELVPYARDVYGPKQRKAPKDKAVTVGECTPISKDEHYFDVETVNV